MEFTKDTTLNEILKFPEAEKILEKHSVPCLSCPIAKYEARDLTLGQICLTYGLDLETILKELEVIRRDFTEGTNNDKLSN